MNVKLVPNCDFLWMWEIVGMTFPLFSMGDIQGKVIHYKNVALPFKYRSFGHIQGGSWKMLIINHTRIGNNF